MLSTPPACVLRRLQEIVTISVFGNKIPLVKLDIARTTKLVYGGFNSWNFLVRCKALQATWIVQYA